MATYTISHSERNGGWTSFWSYLPDWFSRLNNRLYTIKNGQLYLHNDQDNAVRNNFYGTQYVSTVKTIFNDAMAEDKIFKTLALEANQKWEVQLATNYTESTINANEFTTRESRQMTFIRGNEGSSLRGNASQGIGRIQTVVGFVLSFNRLPDMISIGDNLYQLNGSDEELIGTITAIDRTARTITVDAFTNTPDINFFAYSKKNARAEGEEVRGYHMTVTLTNNDTSESELFAVSTNVAKSHV